MAAYEGMQDADYLENVSTCSCGERWCNLCDVHWADCECRGPHDEDELIDEQLQVGHEYFVFNPVDSAVLKAKEAGNMKGFLKSLQKWQRLVNEAKKKPHEAKKKPQAVSGGPRSMIFVEPSQGEMTVTLPMYRKKQYGNSREFVPEIEPTPTELAKVGGRALIDADECEHSGWSAYDED